MGVLGRPLGGNRLVSGGSISGIGVLLLSATIYEMWDDFIDWNLGLLTIALENITFLLLSVGIIVGGLWLIRSDWAPHRVAMVAKWTAGGCFATLLLFGGVISLQLWAIGQLEPVVIAMHGILISTTVAFGTGIRTARMNLQRSELDIEREAKSSLEALHRIAMNLQQTETPRTAYDTVLDGVDLLLSPQAAQITIDGETVVTQPPAEAPSPSSSQSTITAPVGNRGQVKIFGDTFETYSTNTLWLLGTHLDRALVRIDRERALEAERNQLSLINRALRHEILNAIQIIQSRLEIIGVQDNHPDEHWSVIMDQTEGVAQFIQRMREYIHLVERDDHELEPVPLDPVLEDKVTTMQDTYQKAEISLRGVPEVEVMADRLLGPLFENLLRNAIEHNDRETPEVHVTCERDSSMVTIEVTDNGPGIPAAQREAIVGRDERIDGGSEDGFGLHLVTKTIRAYGGTLEIRDDDPVGTVIRVSLPVAE